MAYPDPNPIRSISIPTTRVVAPNDGRKPYTRYVIRVRLAENKWRIERRFSEFYKLDKVLRRKYPYLMPKRVTMPPKTPFNMSPRVVETRRVTLQDYLVQLSYISVPSPEDHVLVRIRELDLFLAIPRHTFPLLQRVSSEHLPAPLQQRGRASGRIWGQPQPSQGGATNEGESPLGDSDIEDDHHLYDLIADILHPKSGTREAQSVAAFIESLQENPEQSPTTQLVRVSEFVERFSLTLVDGRMSELLGVFRAGRLIPLGERSFATQGRDAIPASVPGVLPSVSDSLVAQRLTRQDYEEPLDDKRVSYGGEAGAAKRKPTVAVARVVNKRENEFLEAETDIDVTRRIARRAIEARVIAALAADLQYRALQVGGAKDLVIRHKIASLVRRHGLVPQAMFGIPAALQREDKWHAAVRCLDRMADEVLPTRMMKCLLRTVEEIQRGSMPPEGAEDAQGFGADEFLPCFIYVFAACHLTWPATLFTYMTKLLPESDFVGPVAYYATAFESVLEYVQFLLDTDMSSASPTPAPVEVHEEGGSWEGEHSSESDGEDGKGLSQPSTQAPPPQSKSTEERKFRGVEASATQAKPLGQPPPIRSKEGNKESKESQGGSGAKASDSLSSESPSPRLPRRVPAGLHLQPGGSIQSPGSRSREPRRDPWESSATAQATAPSDSDATPTPRVPLLYESMTEAPPEATGSGHNVVEDDGTVFPAALQHPYFRTINGATAAKLLTFRYSVTRGLGASLGHSLPPHLANTKAAVFRSASARLPSSTASTAGSDASRPRAADDVLQGDGGAHTAALRSGSALKQINRPSTAKWMWIVHPAPFTSGAFAVATFLPVPPRWTPRLPSNVSLWRAAATASGTAAGNRTASSQMPAPQAQAQKAPAALRGGPSLGGVSTAGGSDEGISLVDLRHTDGRMRQRRDDSSGRRPSVLDAIVSTSDRSAVAGGNRSEDFVLVPGKRWSPEDLDVTAASLMDFVRHVLFHQDEEGYFWFQCFAGDGDASMEIGEGPLEVRRSHATALPGQEPSSGLVRMWERSDERESKIEVGPPPKRKGHGGRVRRRAAGPRKSTERKQVYRSSTSPSRSRSVEDTIAALAGHSYKACCNATWVGVEVEWQGPFQSFHACFASAVAYYERGFSVKHVQRLCILAAA